MTASTLRTTTVSPCCHSCHAEGFVRAGFDPTEPYVIYSNLKTLPAKARRELLDALVSNAESDVVLIVSAPVPAEFRRPQEDDEADNSTVAVDPDDPPTPEELDAMFGTARDKGTH